MVEEAYNSIISAGSVAVILTAGLILVYRHLNKDIKDLKAQMIAKDVLHTAQIAAKDLIIEKKDNELKEIVRENIALQTRILDILNIITHERS